MTRPDFSNFVHMSRLAPWAALAAVLTVAPWPFPSYGSNAEIAEGRHFAEANCARCHAIELEDKSPLSEAPPLRTLHERYPVEHLAEALAEGIVTGHADMPEFRLEPQLIDSFIAYLKTLEPPEKN